jgi:hypothetical protein
MPNWQKAAHTLLVAKGEPACLVRGSHLESNEQTLPYRALSENL